MCLHVCGGDIPWGMEDLGLGAKLCMPQHVTIFPWLIASKRKWEEKTERENRISIAGLPALSCCNSVINLLRLMTQMSHMALLILSLSQQETQDGMAIRLHVLLCHCHIFNICGLCGLYVSVFSLGIENVRVLIHSCWWYTQGKVRPESRWVASLKLYCLTKKLSVKKCLPWPYAQCSTGKHYRYTFIHLCKRIQRISAWRWIFHFTAEFLE